MTSGIEAVGVVLGLLPLLINQIDGYVQSYERLKYLSTSRYLKQLERWKDQLETEQVLLNDSLEVVLCDEASLMTEAEVRALLQGSKPGSQTWDKDNLERALRSSLDKFYPAFKSNVVEASSILTQLNLIMTMSEEVGYHLGISFM